MTERILTKMSLRLVLAFLAYFVGLSWQLNGELVEQECPVDCHCHYFRINWVTDCSESNLTAIPFENLSLNVYVLDINGNNVKDIAPFPPDIKLRRLQMAHNQLEELRYESFAGLSYLIDADFSFNKIKYIDPDAFKDSPGLISLELQNNPLEEITEEFLSCRTLLHLDLSSCNISRINPHFFDNTTNLSRLDLSNNPLKTLDPRSLDQLVNLQYLKLTNCNLSSIHPETFSKLENLRELELGENNLRTVVWSMVLEPLVRLEYLDLRQSNLTDLPGDAFAKNNYLIKLVLADNELTYLNVDNTLGQNLLNLHSLDLSNCHLHERLSEEAFRNATQLRSLDLSGNPMFASDLTRVLRHLPQLQKLSLSNCSLRKLPEAFEDLQLLQELDISHNPLEDAFIRLLNPLRSLEYLDMSYCSLGYVGNNTFAQMTSLQRLILSGNPLHTLEQGLFANLSRLNSLELNNCGLQNPFDPRLFGEQSVTNILDLRLAKNPLEISETEPLLPRQLASLQLLDLSGCNIRKLHDQVFLYTKNLTHLNLSSNSLSDPESLRSLQDLGMIEHLDFSNNKLSTVRPQYFSRMLRLHSLNLMNNPFVCNCSIVEMWDWALHEKKDLDVLIGSQPSQFTTAKIRRTLSCSYDAATYRNLLESSKTPVRKGDMTPHRTWAKFIRESVCERHS